MRNKAKNVAFLGLCTALALILAYVELLLQPLFPTIPGIKMGLPNIIIIFLLYRRGCGLQALNRPMYQVYILEKLMARELP